MDGSRDDELLADPPLGDHHLGRLAGYQAGERARRRRVLALAAGVVVVVIGGVLYLRHAYLHRPPVYTVPLPPGTDIAARPRTLTWTGGRGHFALTREPPGLAELELPDRIIRLADGAESAEVRVDVQDGRTIERTLLRGEIREELLNPP